MKTIHKPMGDVMAAKSTFFGLFHLQVHDYSQLSSKQLISWETDRCIKALTVKTKQSCLSNTSTVTTFDNEIDKVSTGTVIL